ERRVGLRTDGDPASAHELGRRIAVRVDVNEFDSEFLGPQATRRAFEPGIGAVGAFGIRGPEDDHLGFLEAILDPAIARRNANAHRIAEMMDGAPVPALPTVRVGGDPGEAD